MRFQFHDPSGELTVTQPHAPRIETLNDKKIGFLTNDQWQAFRMLPKLRELIAQDFPRAELLPLDAFPQGNAEIPKEATAELVKLADVDFTMSLSG